MFNGDGTKEFAELERAVFEFEDYAGKLSKKSAKDIGQDREMHNSAAGGDGKRASDIDGEMKILYQDIQKAKEMYIKNEDPTFLNDDQRMMLTFAKELDKHFHPKEGINNEEFNQQFKELPFQTLVSKAFTTISGKRGSVEIGNIRASFEKLLEQVEVESAFEVKRSYLSGRFINYLEGKLSQQLSLADRLETAIEDIFKTYKEKCKEINVPGTMTSIDPIEFLHS